MKQVIGSSSFEHKSVLNGVIFLLLFTEEVKPREKWIVAGNTGMVGNIAAATRFSNFNLFARYFSC